MHPYIAQHVIAQRQQTLAGLAGSRRTGRAVTGRPVLPLARIPYWRVSWSRLASASGEPGGRTLMIIISARRAIRPTW
jgi:hypothetical protein